MILEFGCQPEILAEMIDLHFTPIIHTWSPFTVRAFKATEKKKTTIGEKRCRFGCLIHTGCGLLSLGRRLH
jgi:hypothetical protein